MHAIFLILRLFQLLMWLSVNCIYKIIQQLIWELNGTASVLRQSFKNPNSKTSAQVLSVYWKFKFCDYVMKASKWDFILGHERFESPEYVLQDHITLYAISNTEAIFVETTPGRKVWETKYNPSFFMAAQFYAASKVVVMPIESLHYLADRLGGKGKLIFVSNCARCGSTLLTQIFEATERFVAFGEPNCMNFLAKANDLQTHKESHESFERLAISTIRVLCKPTESGNEMGYLIKIVSPSMTATPLLMKLFPKSFHLYMYRDPLKVAQSLYRLSCSLYSLRFIYFIGKNSAKRFAACMSTVGFPPNQYKFKIKDDLNFGILNWCVLLKQYLDFRRSKLNVAAVRYEDLVKHVKKAITKIFRYCEIPIDLVDKAEEAMNWDSQRGTPLSTDVLQKFPVLPCTGETKEETEKIMKTFGFPSIDEEYIAEWTITHPTFEL